MKLPDEELQERMDEGTNRETSVDAESYRVVFAALRQEPEFTLPSGFADKVVNAIVREKVRKESKRDAWLFIGGLALFIIGLVVTVVLIDFKPDAGVYTFVSGYRMLLSFAVAFALLLHFLDKKFVRSTPEVK